MTVEELQIIVDASIEPAINEMKKLMPQIKKQVSQIVETVQNSMNNINMKSVSNKVQQSIQFVKKKIESLKKSNQNNEIAIKINNKDAQKQVNQIQKQIDSLQEKINSRQMKLSVITPRLDEITTKTTKEVTPEGLSSDNPAIQNTINNSLNSNKEYTSLSAQESKMTQEITMYNKQLNEAKSKMAQLGQQTSQTATTQNKLSSFFGVFKQKIDQVKPSIGNIKNTLSQIPKITQNITNNISKMGSGLKQGLRHVLRYAMALFSLRGIYSVLSNAAQSWLSSQNKGAQQLSANIEYMKYAMGSAFAPVIEYVINLVYQLMKAIQSLVYAFSGVNIFAKATASSMNKTAKSAKDTNKSLSGVHSEINNVSENKDSGGSGTTSPNMDLSQMDTSMNSWIDKIKEKLAVLFQPIQNSWSNYGQPLIESMKHSFTGIGSLIDSIRNSFQEVWLNGTGEYTANTILQILTSVFNIIGNIGDAYSKAWENNGGTEIVQSLWNGFNNLLDIISGVFQVFEEWTKSESFQVFANSIIGITGTLSSWFEKLTQKLKEIWENGGKQTFEKLLEFISKAVEAIDAVLKALSPVVDFILGIVTPVIEGIINAIGFVIDALSGVLDFIIGVFTGDWDKAWSGISKFFEGIWNAIKSIIDTVLKFISNLWNTIWNGLKNTVTTIWNGIKTLISNVIDGIKNTISNVLNAIKTVWNNIWTGIKTTVVNIWNGIWGAIKGVINCILGGIEGFVNGVIKGINFLLGGISNVANAIGSLIGLNPINLRISTISLPRLAKGGVLTEATALIAGEYSGAKSNPEIVTPQNIMYDTMKRALADSNTNNNKQIIQLSVYVGNTKLGQILLEDLRNMKRQTGRDIEALVGG